MSAAICVRRTPSQTSAIPIPMPTAEVSINVAKRVRIINPVENGSNITSRKRALQFVQSGRAVFVGSNLLRFIEADPRNQAAVRRAARGYEEVDRMMSKTEIANIPLARPATAFKELMTDRSGSRGRHAPFGRSGPVHVFVEAGTIRETLKGNHSSQSANSPKSPG